MTQHCAAGHQCSVETGDIARRGYAGISASLKTEIYEAETNIHKFPVNFRNWMWIFAMAVAIVALERRGYSLGLIDSCSCTRPQIIPAYPESCRIIIHVV
jgi:hypothetical protein